MKILLVTDKFYPENTTVGAIVFRVAQSLKKEGQNIFIVTTTRNKQEVGESEYDGLRVSRIYANYHERFRAYLGLYNPQTVKSFEKIVSEFKPDVVHFHNIHYYLSYYCLKIAKKSGAKVFLTAHDVMLFHYGKLKEFINPKDFSCPKVFNYKVSIFQLFLRFRKRYNPFRNLFIKYYLRYADHIFSVSYALKDALWQNGIKKVEVLPNGIDFDGWTFDYDKIVEIKRQYKLEGKKVILFGGRLSIEKGGHQAILFLKELKKNVPNAVLFILGPIGDYSEKMLSFARSLDVEKDVVFAGWLSGNNLRATYKLSDVVIVPSLCFDSFPTVILEAAISKKAVVATCFGGAQEMIIDGKTGFVANPFDVFSFSQKICKLLNDPTKATMMGEEAFKFIVEKFSLAEHIKKLVKWYSNER